MPTPKRVRLELFADYHQVHVLDAASETNLGDAWTAKATADGVAATKDAIAIGTMEADDVLVEIEIRADAPPTDLGAWDHVVEASLDVASGKVVIMGCTDYLPDAKKLAVAKGTWALRASHGDRAHPKKKERIRLQMWPAKRAKPRVVKRWMPPPPAAPKPVGKGRPRNAKAAAALARAGNTDGALEALLAFAKEGDVAASASAAELLAFRGLWADVLPLVTAYLVGSAKQIVLNEVVDMCRLARRAAREIGDTKAIAALAKRMPASLAGQQNAVLLREYAPAADASKTAAARTAFARAVEDAGPRFKGKSKELARHVLALAMAYNLDDELIARWDAKNPELSFDQAVAVARAHARRKRSEEAWRVLSKAMTRWWPLDFAQVAPLVLLYDPSLARVMTKERCEKVLATPRAVGV